jgi:hypothetical protein
MQRLTSELAMIPLATKEDNEKVQKCLTSLNNITSDNFKPMLQVS